MTIRRPWNTACALFLLCAATTIASPAQEFTKLLDFNGTNGAGPGSLVQGRDGSLYGTTTVGGSSSSMCNDGCGTIFRITRGGILKTLYSFCSQNGCSDGTGPVGLVLASDGNFYGSASYGGDLTCQPPSGCGTVFKITPHGTLTTLHTFKGTDGASPEGPLVEGIDGNFYGTTAYGGSSSACAGGCGTIFKITAKGNLTTLYSLDSVNGISPFSALVSAADGNFYSTTAYGGANSYGTVFRITPGGALTTLHSFNLTDGAFPYSSLVQSTDGSLYGTTSAGGVNNDLGTVFKITLGGTLTSYDFCGQPSCGDGVLPYAGLIQATDGNSYGTTYEGGENLTCKFGCGTVFAMTPGGSLGTLHSFSSTDGADPYSALVQATDGTFYGTTNFGGDLDCHYGFDRQGCGTAFSLNLGLGPFVALVRSAGRVGQTGGILGQGLTGTTSVSLNGTPAHFTVVSDTFLKATVPPGATTGYVTVTTPSGTLSSNVPFHVIR